MIMMIVNDVLIGTAIFLIVGGGVGITVGTAKFQNYKHGYPQKQDDDDEE